MEKWAEWRVTKRDVERRVRRWRVKQLWKAPILWIAGVAVWGLNRLSAR